MKSNSTLALAAIVLIAIFQMSCHFFECSRSSLGNEDDIREALFRHLFMNNESGLQSSAAAYCLEIEGKDPADEFMGRFQQHSPVVRKRSDCARVPDSSIQETATHRRALLFQVGKIRDLDNCGVEIEAGYYEANLSASGASYVLSRSNGRWKVTATYHKWIS